MKINHKEVTILTKCPICGGLNEIAVNEDDYWDWQDGALVQETFTYLNADEREMLISGICPTCWNRTFDTPEEEDDDDPCFEPGRPIINMFDLNP